MKRIYLNFNCLDIKKISENHWVLEVIWISVEVKLK